MPFSPDIHRLSKKNLLSESGAELEMETDHIKYPWQQTVVDAFLAKPAELGAKINMAELAILARLKQIHSVDFAERIALEDALRALRVLIAEAKADDASRRKEEDSPKPTSAAG